MNENIRNNLAAGLLLSITLVGLTACGGGSDARELREAVTVNELGITSIDVTSANPIVEVSGVEIYTATAQIDSGASTLDVTDQVRWSTTDSSVASVSQSGKATALSNGMVTVIAELADLRGSKDLIASDAVLQSIDVSSDVVGGGRSVGVCTYGHQLTATGNYADSYGPRTITNLVAWSSSAEEIAEVDEFGKIKTLKDGIATMTATRKGVSSDTPTPWVLTVLDNLVSVVITPQNPTVSVGSDLQFSAAGTYADDSVADITPTVTWSSANVDASTPLYLDVSDLETEKGLAEGKGAGDATVTAVCNSTTLATVTSATVKVEAAVTVVDVEISGSMRVNLSDSPVQLVATLQNSDSTTAGIVTDSDDIDWRIGDTIEGVAATVSNVSGSKGEVTFTALGKTEIKVLYDDGINEPFDDTITFIVE